eukprot:Clim_evm45s172 gene=Clim_evmTU45s172
MANQSAKKQAESNKQTLFSHLIMVIAAIVIHFLGHFAFRMSEVDQFDMIAFGICGAVQGACYFILFRSGNPKYGARGELVSAGTDLNMEGGILEYIKDIMYLLLLSQIISCYSYKAFYIMLLVPAYAVYKIFSLMLGGGSGLLGGSGNGDPQPANRAQRRAMAKGKKE